MSNQQVVAPRIRKGPGESGGRVVGSSEREVALYPKYSIPGKTDGIVQSNQSGQCLMRVERGGPEYIKTCECSMQAGAWEQAMWTPKTWVYSEQRRTNTPMSGTGALTADLAHT